MATTKEFTSQEKDLSKYLFIPPKNPLFPHQTIVIGPCHQGIPCQHCFSQDNAKTFNPKYGHDIFAFVRDTTDPYVRSHINFKHLRGMYDANKLLRYKPFTPIKLSTTDHEL